MKGSRGKLLKLIASIALFVISSYVSAGTLGQTCDKVLLNIPCAHKSWSLAGQALYLQTTFNKDFSYYPTGANNIYDDFSGFWNWGFLLTGAYQFSSGNDLLLSWYRYEANNKHLDFAPLGPFNPFNMQLDTSSYWDAVAAEFGQTINLNSRSILRVHGGFEFSRIKASTEALLSYDINSPFYIPDFYPLNATEVNQTVRFNGFGPRAGLDMNYDLDSGFSIYAKSAAAIQTGITRFYNKALVPDNTGELRSLYAQGRKFLTVPELEVKVGLTYLHPYREGHLIFDVGYMWFSYFNALNNQNVVGNIQLNQTLTDSVGTSDFAASGPYIGLKYVNFG